VRKIYKDWKQILWGRNPPIKRVKNLKNGIKYCQATNYRHDSLLTGEFGTRSGLYSWINVFRGDVFLFKEIKDKLNDFDIIQVNLSGQDWHLVNNIRELIGKDSSTKIVANCDYVTELWQNSFDYLDTMRRELTGADMLFGTEPYMCGALAELTGRKVFEIPHPTHVKRLKSLTKRESNDYLSVNWHRYDNFTMIPSLAARNHGLKTQLIGYEVGSDKRRWTTSPLYDRIIGSTNFLDFCETLMESKLVYEPFTLNSYGRTTVETAALGIPTVGSDRVASIRQCFPKTMCNPYDVQKSRELIEKVIKDEKFRDEVVEYANNAVEHYNFENSSARYLAALSECEKKHDYKL